MSIKKPVTDPLILSTEGQPGVTGKIVNEILDSWRQPRSREPLVPLSDHQKAIASWKAEAEKWKKAYHTALDNAGAWREVAADYAFNGRPYPEQGTPAREEFGANFRKISNRKKAARTAGAPEEDRLI